MTLDNDWLLTKLFAIPPILFSLVIHEYAHARTALAFGDDTARLSGRLTLNPLAHLDPMGTLMIIFAGFGWARPVPVNPTRMSPRALGSVMVSLAGPLSNLGIAVVSMLGLRLWIQFGPGDGSKAAAFGAEVLAWLAVVNVALFVFNLVPLLPLDGHHVVREILPMRRQEAFMAWQRPFGMMALLALLFGPRLLRGVTGNPNVPDPLGFVMGTISNTLLRAVIGW